LNLNPQRLELSAAPDIPESLCVGFNSVLARSQPLHFVSSSRPLFAAVDWPASSGHLYGGIGHRRAGGVGHLTAKRSRSGLCGQATQKCKGPRARTANSNQIAQSTPIPPALQHVKNRNLAGISNYGYLPPGIVHARGMEAPGEERNHRLSRPLGDRLQNRFYAGHRVIRVNVARARCLRSKQSFTRRLFANRTAKADGTRNILLQIPPLAPSSTSAARPTRRLRHFAPLPDGPVRRARPARNSLPSSICPLRFRSAISIAMTCAI